MNYSEIVGFDGKLSEEQVQRWRAIEAEYQPAIRNAQHAPRPTRFKAPVHVSLRCFRKLQHNRRRSHLRHLWRRIPLFSHDIPSFGRSSRPCLALQLDVAGFLGWVSTPISEVESRIQCTNTSSSQTQMSKEHSSPSVVTKSAPVPSAG